MGSACRFGMRGWRKQLGSALGAYGWSHWRWSGVCVAGTLQLVVALAVRTWMHVRRETLPVATARETSLA